MIYFSSTSGKKVRKRISRPIKLYYWSMQRRTIECLADLSHGFLVVYICNIQGFSSTIFVNFVKGVVEIASWTKILPQFGLKLFK